MAKWIPAPYGSKLHIPATNCCCLAAQQVVQKAYLVIRNSGEFSGKKVERMDHQQKNDKAGTRPKSERGEGKGESRQIPDGRIAGTSAAAVHSKCTSKWQNRESDVAAHYHRTKTEVHSAHASTCYKPMESTTMKVADCTAPCTLVLQRDH